MYVQEQVRTCVQNKLMTDTAVGPGGSLNSIDLYLNMLPETHVMRTSYFLICHILRMRRLYDDLN